MGSEQVHQGLSNKNTWHDEGSHSYVRVKCTVDKGSVPDDLGRKMEVRVKHNVLECGRNLKYRASVYHCRNRNL